MIAYIKSLFLRLRLPNFIWWGLIAATSVAICVILEWQGTGYANYPGDEWLRDQYVKIDASNQPENRVVLVDIDETSLASIGVWPWSRETIADLIEQLIGTYQAKGVALDIFFADSSDSIGDQRLRVLAQHGPVILAQAFDYDAGRAWPLKIGALAGGSLANMRSAAKNAGPIAYGFVANHALLAKNAKAGNIGFVPDPDGVLRRLPLTTRFEGKTYPSLALALYECCANRNIQPKSSQDAFLNKKDGAGFNRVTYRKAWSAYKVLHAANVLEGAIPTDWLKDKLVIVGSSSISLSDRVATPLFFKTNGFLVHAAVLTSLLDNQEGELPSSWHGQWLAVIYSVIVAGIAIYMFPRFSALSNTIMLALLSMTWLVLAYKICQHDPFFFPTAPLLVNFFLLAVAVPFGWQTSQGKSRRLLGTLQKYVAKSVVKELLRSDLRDPLKPRELQITTLIADMEGYTSQVEHLPIEESAMLTREFLECLTAPVLDKGGTLDKYTGDGLVAFWGAPLPVERHADLAIDAAIEIVRNVKALSKLRNTKGMKPIRVRIGIESGLAIAGDFGSSLRSIYTAVGDSVNVASRLEDAARDLPHDIIIGYGTVSLSTKHHFIKLEERILRGKEKATTLFTVEINE